MTTVSRTGERRVARSWWLVLAPPLATVVLTVVAEYVASDGFSAAPELSPLVGVEFLLWGASAALGLAGLAALTLLRGWRGRVALVVGGMALLLVTAAILWASLDDESSTAALGLFAPLYGWVVVGLTGVVVLVTSLVARRPTTSR